MVHWRGQLGSVRAIMASWKAEWSDLGRFYSPRGPEKGTKNQSWSLQGSQRTSKLRKIVVWRGVEKMFRK